MKMKNANPAFRFGFSPRSKYGARKTEYAGNMYASQREANYAAELDLRVRARDIKSWRGQIPFELKVNGIKICRHIPDFEITHNDNSLEIVEVKGMWTPEAKLKRKLFEALFPELRYTVIK